MLKLLPFISLLLVGLAHASPSDMAEVMNGGGTVHKSGCDGSVSGACAVTGLVQVAPSCRVTIPPNVVNFGNLSFAAVGNPRKFWAIFPNLNKTDVITVDAYGYSKITATPRFDYGSIKPRSGNLTGHLVLTDPDGREFILEDLDGDTKADTQVPFTLTETSSAKFTVKNYIIGAGVGGFGEIGASRPGVHMSFTCSQ